MCVCVNCPNTVMVIGYVNCPNTVMVIGYVNCPFNTVMVIRCVNCPFNTVMVLFNFVWYGFCHRFDTKLEMYRDRDR